ncbi:MAG: WecB/TagA/CpsF family glycosyltransferase [Thermoplasmata archaeon]|nr:WecB/TagA/CpsF family glycosyltransferase [Thermoplasmata archaeon]
MESHAVLGVRIDNITMNLVFREIKQAIVENRKLIITPVNIRVVMEARKNRELFEMLQHSDINTPDSGQISYLVKLRNFKFAERVTGADLFAAFPAFAAEHGIRIGIFGGFGSVEKTKERIQREAGAEVVFTCSPSAEEVLHTPGKIIAQINAASPQVLFVALGCPKQELWIWRHHSKLAVNVFVSIGAGLDFYAGVQKRAPAWMQRAGIEWMGRLFGNPGKMATRYLTELRFYYEFLKETVRRKG